MGNPSSTHRRFGVPVAVAAGILPPALIIAGYLYDIHLPLILTYSITLYGVFINLHLLLQMAYARKELHGTNSTSYKPKVSAVIPVYNEDLEMFSKCLESLRNQTGTDLEVIVANDGTLVPDIREVFENQKGVDWKYLNLPHRGKREAMYDGFKASNGDILVFCDSDTIFSPSCISELVRPFANPRVGATTGNVRIYNNQSLLGKLTDFRYWIAFNLERAAQSHFNVVSCISGPCGAYRRIAIEMVLDDWVNQKFFGRKCTYGDDRHLTNLVLAGGYETKYVAKAEALTMLPSTKLKWARQQLRWARSFYREFLVNLGTFANCSPWLAYDLTYLALFPIFVLFNIMLVLTRTAFMASQVLPIYLSIVLTSALIRPIYGAVKTRDSSFLAFALYGFLFVCVLLPLKIYSLFSLNSTAWGSRGDETSTSIPIDYILPFCRKCGARIKPPEAYYCYKCGTKAEPALILAKTVHVTDLRIQQKQKLSQHRPNLGDGDAFEVS